MTTKAKNTVKAKPAANPKAAMRSLPTKVVANIRTKPASTAKAVPPAKVATKVAIKNSVTKSVVTPTKTVKAEKLSKADKPKKIKMVRDSFSMPENEYSQFAALKKKYLVLSPHLVCRM